ncbi:glycosyltransferase [Mycobacterium adipatum]|uniref:glycosyltransferase n=1 Tax=Mycobacterium adipatum TaxID=1682113 RepID=UPI0034E0D8CE
MGYLVSRFPSVSQTFILNELKELEDLGWDVRLLPMIKTSESVVHPGAAEIAERALFFGVPTFTCARANIHWAMTKPWTYLKAIGSAFTLPGRKVRFYARGLWSALWAVMVASEVEKQGIRHIHAHWATFPAHAALVVSQLTGCTYSFTAHAHDIYANAYGLQKKIEHALFVVTISDFNKRYLMSRVSGGRFEVIRCGVDTRRLSFAPRQLSPRSAMRLLAVGSLEEKKGHEYLVDACSRLLANGFSVECRIVGEGPERSHLERLISELNLRDRVTLIGSLSSDAVVTELNWADVFVMPSVIAGNGMMEGIPVALMEAMASGVPVIASGISGIPELVQHGVSGLLVGEKDAGAIASAVQTMYGDDRLRQSLSIAARDAVVQRYDLANNVKTLAAEFEKAVTRRG